MPGILDKFRKQIVNSVWKEPEEPVQQELNDKIALGVLLWVVAQADNQFLPEEKEKIKEVLQKFSAVSESGYAVILESIEYAAQERIDLHTFTHEVSQGLSYDVKVSIVEDLFRVACIDNDLAHDEVEAIRKIAGLFQIDHSDFIDAKIKVKKEFGMDTAGL